jgi:hypothetical protein
LATGAALTNSFALLLAVPLCLLILPLVYAFGRIRLKASFLKGKFDASALITKTYKKLIYLGIAVFMVLVAVALVLDLRVEWIGYAFVLAGILLMVFFSKEATSFSVYCLFDKE